MYQSKELHPAIHWVAKTDLAHATLYSFCTIIFLVPILLYVFKQPWEVIIPFVMVAAVLSFGLIAVQRMVVLLGRIVKQVAFGWYAWVEAKAELATGIDLNHSGRIGDVPSQMAAGRIIEGQLERPIIANKSFPEQRRWKRGEGEKQVTFYESEIGEFIERARVPGGMARKNWTGEKASDGTTKPQYQFTSTGRGCTREIYDLLVDTIIQMAPEAIVGRSKGHDGKLVYPDKVLSAFKLLDRQDALAGMDGMAGTRAAGI